MSAAIGREEHLTFKGNLKRSRYGWLRLTPAYSVHLVRDLLEANLQDDLRVLDPFCGTGTTALVCAEHGVATVTTDINPFLIWLASAKTAAYSAEDIGAFVDVARDVVSAMRANHETPEWLPALHQIEKWWAEETLHALGRGMARIRNFDGQVTEKTSDLLRIAFCKTLIERAAVSFGHQSMSFKRNGGSGQASLFADGDQSERVAQAWGDAVQVIAESSTSQIITQPEAVLCDARRLGTTIEPSSIQLVLTSPPYPNRMSYIRELRPYMYWLGYITDAREAGELDWEAIGGTWGCATSNVGKWTPTEQRVIPLASFDDILGRIAQRSDVLSRYVHKYFFDMVEHVQELVSILTEGATIHYIVGNSKFYDVVLPVEQIYGRLFEAQGLEEVRIDTIRKRSSKRELFEYVVSAKKPA